MSIGLLLYACALVLAAGTRPVAAIASSPAALVRSAASKFPTAIVAATSPVPLPSASAASSGDPLVAPARAESPAGRSSLKPGPPPAASATSASRAHLHRPGTDVDGDVLTGSLASEVYVFRGSVTLHSDPKTDREIADASQSDDPLTVTADEIDVDKVGLTYVAKGHVHFEQGTRSGQADLAMLNQQTHTLDLIGNADVLDGDHRAVATKMHYNTLDKNFRGSGDVRIYEPVPTPDPNVVATPVPKKHKLRLPI